MSSPLLPRPHPHRGECHYCDEEGGERLEESGGAVWLISSARCDIIQQAYSSDEERASAVGCYYINTSHGPHGSILLVHFMKKKKPKQWRQ